MKIKTFLILVSILITTKQFCQEYEPVIKEGSFWDIKTTVFASSCSTSDIESIKRIQIAGDTIINNMTYKKLKSAFLQDDDDTDPCFIPPLYVNENNFTPIEDSYLRENINERKLYILTNSITGNTLEEYTVCDFSLNIGDKIDNYFGFNNNEVGNELIVDDIKLDENDRKVFYLNDGSYYTEAIGRNEGNLNIYFNLVDGTYETLYCFGNALNQNNCAAVVVDDYDPVIKEGSFWDVSESDGSGCPYYYRYRLADNFVYDNITYRSLEVAPIRGQDNPNELCGPSGSLFANENDFTSVNGKYIREDLTEKKVYILVNENDIYNEYVLANFNLNVGDTFENAYTDSDSANTLTVTQISTKANGRKIYILNNNQSFEESVGNSQGPIFNYHWHLGSYGFSVFCNGNAQNQDNCATVLSIEKNELSYIKIFPNPADDFLMIKNTDDITIKLYSLNGSLLKTVKTKSNLEIDVSSFSSGIYILEFLNYNSKSRRKIIKL